MPLNWKAKLEFPGKFSFCIVTSSLSAQTPKSNEIMVLCYQHIATNPSELESDYMLEAGSVTCMSIGFVFCMGVTKLWFSSVYLYWISSAGANHVPTAYTY